jgi:hypothetical protein
MLDIHWDLCGVWGAIALLLACTRTLHVDYFPQWYLTLPQHDIRQRFCVQSLRYMSEDYDPQTWAHQTWSRAHEQLMTRQMNAELQNVAIVQAHSEQIHTSESAAKVWTRRRDVKLCQNHLGPLD